MAKNLWAAIGQQTSRIFFYLCIAMTVAFTVFLVNPAFRSNPFWWLVLAVFWVFAYIRYRLNFSDSSFIRVVTKIQLTPQENLENAEGGGGVGAELEGYYECPICHIVFRGDGFCFNCLMRKTGLPPRVVFKGKTIV